MIEKTYYDVGLGGGEYLSDDVFAGVYYFRCAFVLFKECGGLLGVVVRKSGCALFALRRTVRLGGNFERLI